MIHKGIHITSLSHGAETVAEWTYDGGLDLEPVPVYWRPGARDAEDAANLALSLFLPIMAAVGECVELPYPVSSQSVRFWRRKLGALSPLCKQPFQLDISPIDARAHPQDRAGTGVGLLFGGGVDSTTVLGQQLDAGTQPHLVRICSREKPNGAILSHGHGAAKAAGVELTEVWTNADPLYGEWADLWLDRIKVDDPYFDLYRLGPRRSSGYRANVQLTTGFLYFFTALCGLPPDVTTVLIACSASDCTEPDAYGWRLSKDVPYRNVQCHSACAGEKAAEYRYLYENHPELLRWVKPCEYEHGQWCGHCRKCYLAHLVQRMLGAEPIPVTVRTGEVPIRLEWALSLWIDYQSQWDRDESLRAPLLDVLKRALDG